MPLSSSFESFLGRSLARNALKTRCFSREAYEKVKYHRAIAPAALGGYGGLGQLWEALAELWDPTLDLILDHQKTSRDSSDCKKHMVKCQVAKMLTVKTQ